MNCKICSAEAVFFDRARVLHQYDVSYFRCTSCGFIQTEEPYWLPEAYRTAITSTDLGYIARNLYTARLTKTCVALCFDRRSALIDYGGGYGMFVRLMRDAGFNFYRDDRYCLNLFADGFDADTTKRYELLTAFEVLEHLNEPLADLERMFQFSGNLLFSTQLLPDPAPKVTDWPYFSPHHGQHIAFYTAASLRYLAEKWKVNYIPGRHGYHLFTTKKISPWLFQRLCGGHVNNIFDQLVHFPTLLNQDIAERTRASAGL